GLGAVNAAAILIEMPETGTLGRKQEASLAGLAQITQQSGQWRGKSFIQGGRKHLCGALYMPAMVASRHNPELKIKYTAMTEAGKPAKVALTTLMRKLIEMEMLSSKLTENGSQNCLDQDGYFRWRDGRKSRTANLLTIGGEALAGWVGAFQDERAPVPRRGTDPGGERADGRHGNRREVRQTCQPGDLPAGPEGALRPLPVGDLAGC
ncbi:MAG: IS110 family transposase, partial [Proteobacteria bacterium]|nr:IS110 family transposase [Pseudomonadota bacterium]